METVPPSVVGGTRPKRKPKPISRYIEDEELYDSGILLFSPFPSTILRRKDKARAVPTSVSSPSVFFYEPPPPEELSKDSQGQICGRLDNVEEEDEAYRSKSWQSNKRQRQEMQSQQASSSQLAQPLGKKKSSRLCKIPKCPKYAKGQGFCLAHGGILKRCAVQGCEKYPKLQRLCRAHWSELVRSKSHLDAACKNKEEEKNVAMLPGTPGVGEESRGEKLQVTSVATQGRGEKKKTGEVSKDKKKGKKEKQKKMCSEPGGCSNQAHTSGLCKRHFRALQNAFDVEQASATSKPPRLITHGNEATIEEGFTGKHADKAGSFFHSEQEGRAAAADEKGREKKPSLDKESRQCSAPDCQELAVIGRGLCRAHGGGARVRRRCTAPGGCGREAQRDKLCLYHFNLLRNGKETDQSSPTVGTSTGSSQDSAVKEDYSEHDIQGDHTEVAAVELEMREDPIERKVKSEKGPGEPSQQLIVTMGAEDTAFTKEEMTMRGTNGEEQVEKTAKVDQESRTESGGGEDERVEDERKEEARWCSVPGCDDPPECRGLCLGHANRRKKDRVKCRALEGCLNQAQKDGLCKSHRTALIREASRALSATDVLPLMDGSKRTAVRGETEENETLKDKVPEQQGETLSTAAAGSEAHGISKLKEEKASSAKDKDMEERTGDRLYMEEEGARETREPCSVPGCLHPRSAGSEVCISHGLRSEKRARRGCGAPGGCEKQAKVKGLCMSHFKQQKREKRAAQRLSRSSQQKLEATANAKEGRGKDESEVMLKSMPTEPTLVKPEKAEVADTRQRELTRCCAPGCKNIAPDGGLCLPHFSGKKKIKKFCTAPEGCNRQVHSQGLCQSHKAALKRQIVPPTRPQPLGFPIQRKSDSVRDETKPKRKRGICRAPGGCGTFAKVKGFCRAHHTFFIKTQGYLPEITWPAKVNGEKEMGQPVQRVLPGNKKATAEQLACSAPGCSGQALASGTLCGPHKRGIKKIKRKCQHHNGCEKQAQRRGLCLRHFRSFQETSETTRLGTEERCSFPLCKERAMLEGRCSRHSSGPVVTAKPSEDSRYKATSRVGSSRPQKTVQGTAVEPESGHSSGYGSEDSEWEIVAFAARPAKR